MSHAALYVPLQSNIKAITESIDVLVEDRRIRSIKRHNGGIGSWFHDAALQSRISDLKAASESLSNYCTKLTIVASKSVTAASLESLLGEISQNVDLLGRCYLGILECQLGGPLFKMISIYVRNELSELSNLTEIFAAGDVESAKSAAGMVWSVNDQIQKIPLQNKAAYRRHIMERIGVIKETIEEFDGYLKSAEREGKDVDDDEQQQQLQNDKENGDDEQKENDDDDAFDDDEFADDAEYDIEELGAVRACIYAMRVSEQTLKTGLVVMTSVADAASKAAANPSPPPSLPVGAASASAGAGVAAVPPLPPTEGGGGGDSKKSSGTTGTWSCSEWVATISTSSEAIESAVIDLGSELYPPLVVSTVRTQITNLRTLLDAYAGSLSVGIEHHSGVEEEEVAVKALTDLQTALFELAETAGNY